MGAPETLTASARFQGSRRIGATSVEGSLLLGGWFDDGAGNRTERQPPIIDGEFRTIAETEGVGPARLGIELRPAQTGPF